MMLTCSTQDFAKFGNLPEDAPPYHKPSGYPDFSYSVLSGCSLKALTTGSEAQESVWGRRAPEISWAAVGIWLQGKGTYS